MAHTGCGRVKVKYDVGFLRWLEDQILMIEDHAYAGTNFRGDPDLPLPLGVQWGEIDKKQDSKIFIMFLYFHVFMFL